MRTIRTERQGHLVVLRLDKPRGNAIDEPMVEDLIEACRALDADPAVRGVLLASAHPTLFSPGLDLVGLLDYDRPSMERFLEQFARAVWALYGLGKPVVAALSGHAIAGGCVLALTADYRILRRGGANIGLNEVRIGLPLPWSVALLLGASVGPRALCEVALLGRNFADEEALEVGLVHELAPAEAVEDRSLVRLEELADKEPTALATTKAHLRAETLARMKAGERDRASDFLEAWFSEPTRLRIQATVASLSKKKP